MGNLYRAPERDERFVLTFDDGPHTTFTPRLLDCLAEARLKDGAHNPLVDGIVREHGYQMVLWNVDSQDWKAESRPTNWMEIVAEEIADRRHSTVIFHDNHSLIVDNFAAFLGKVNAIHDVRLIPFVLRRLRPARIRRRVITAINTFRDH